MIASDLIQPKGEIEPDLFEADDPGGDTTERVTEYLSQAEEAAGSISDADTKDKAIAAYVYYRTFLAFSRILRSMPEEHKEGDGSRRYAKSQADSFEGTALTYKAQFDAYLADVAGEIPATSPATISVPVEFVW
jgi:hypothetical protein